MEESIFEAFGAGSLELPEQKKDFSRIPWEAHPSFSGVEMKHIVTAKDTGGAFSFHLVRIAAGKAILSHVHEAQLETHEVIAGGGTCMNGSAEAVYRPGTVSIMQPGAPHEVRAGSGGLCLFAKFFPALC
ncbi:MAG: cupin domain-containing protein [Treponema sp.]|nr:cupin domain-containing protein [Treponema sp.]